MLLAFAGTRVRGHADAGIRPLHCLTSYVSSCFRFFWAADRSTLVRWISSCTCSRCRCHQNRMEYHAVLYTESCRSTLALDKPRTCSHCPLSCMCSSACLLHPVLQQLALFQEAILLSAGCCGRQRLFARLHTHDH